MRTFEQAYEDAVETDDIYDLIDILRESRDFRTVLRDIARVAEAQPKRADELSEEYQRLCRIVERFRKELASCNSDHVDGKFRGFV